MLLICPSYLQAWAFPVLLSPCFYLVQHLLRTSCLQERWTPSRQTDTLLCSASIHTAGSSEALWWAFRCVVPVRNTTKLHHPHIHECLQLCAPWPGCTLRGRSIFQKTTFESCNVPVVCWTCNTLCFLYAVSTAKSLERRPICWSILHQPSRMWSHLSLGFDSVLFMLSFRSLGSMHTGKSPFGFLLLNHANKECIFQSGFFHCMHSSLFHSWTGIALHSDFFPLHLFTDFSKCWALPWSVLGATLLAQKLFHVFLLRMIQRPLLWCSFWNCIHLSVFHRALTERLCMFLG